MTKKHTVIHFECPPNYRKLYYDDAVAELQMFCETVNLAEIESLKFHTNSWGLSSCNWFAENVIAKMSKLQRLDFSDTILYRHRSDLCHSTKSIMLEAADK